MTGLDHNDEREIIGRCLAGEREAFATLVDRYRSMAFTVAYRMVGDGDAANDLAQEGFIAAYRDLRSFRQDSRFSTWLCSIVVNKCRDHLRSGKKMVPVDAVPDLRAGAAADPERAAAIEQTEDRLQQALRELPPEYREVLVLKHVEGWSYEEIAGVLGLSAGALKVRAHRAREMLRTILERSGVMP